MLNNTDLQFALRINAVVIILLVPLQTSYSNHFDEDTYNQDVTKKVRIKTKILKKSDCYAKKLLSYATNGCLAAN